ncbi:hypothetical protein AOQ71_12530 [Bradyrhizobium manausense]|uniref:Uncharacterized protein n=1 Tax=Bradyrhizobium manausense TaxID=989370 RepID=A0A0R3E6L9_9BRAD|nr:hypothetical protein AOQ71_12530 [Bradyrhizobium manausense]
MAHRPDRLTAFNDPYVEIHSTFIAEALTLLLPYAVRITGALDQTALAPDPMTRKPCLVRNLVDDI